MRIVVKIGTNLLTTKDGSLNLPLIKALAQGIAQVMASGNEVVIVTSGAIVAGMGKLGLKTRPSILREKQALASIGQPILMNAYQKEFNNVNPALTVAQILLTRQDFDDRARYLNVRNTVELLLSKGIIPIINENDTVATDEIKFGDNDTLSACVAAKLSADYLILLTDVDGLYRGVPGESELIETVEIIDKAIEKCASGVSSSGKGVGGMKTKIEAARIATAAGVNMIVTNGSLPRLIEKIVSGEKIGTFFCAFKAEGVSARKRWIVGMKTQGALEVDSAAADALVNVNKKRSLLSSGIISVKGAFGAGNMVSIVNPQGVEIAKGFSNYSSNELKKIKGRKSSEIKGILGYINSDEVVHRNNMVILRPE